LSGRRKRTAILISGRGSNMRALIEAARQPDYPASIELVLSNRPDAAGLAHARDMGARSSSARCKSCSSFTAST
jgi:phosphoribosylglycinamide formyltransferase-1